MPDPTTAANPNPQPNANANGLASDASQQPAGGKKYAGKYESPDALLKGIGEARKTLGLDGDLKFTTIEDAEAVYRDYDKMIATRKTAAKPEAKPETGDLSITPKADATTDDDIDMDGVLQKVGLKGDDLAAEYIKNGKLSDDNYAKLKQAGYPKKVVNAMIESQVTIFKTQVDQANAKAIEVAGGEKQHQVLREWAAANMPAEWLNSYAEKIKKNPSVYVEMMEVVAAKHARAVGSAGSNTIINSTVSGGDGGAAPFATAREMRAAIVEANRKYGDWTKDPSLMKRYEKTPRDIRTQVTQ